MRLLIQLLFIFTTLPSFAEIITRSVEYSTGETKMEGYVAFDSALKNAPGILIVHDWMGLNNFTKEKAEQLAKQGYVAFAVDAYGKGNRPKDQKQASEFAGKLKSDIPTLRARMQAAYDTLSAMPEVNKSKLIAMGYCFGGTAALELARSGVPLAGTATFHGGLSTPNPEDAKNIKGKILVLHGADDPYVKADDVKAFKEEMKRAKVKMQFISYPGAVHAFAVPSAGSDKTKGAAYDAKADRKSWLAFNKFLKNTVGN